MFRAIREQIDTIFREDPAARSVIEVLLCYPGLHAILLHRLAHKLYVWGVPLLPRLISQGSRFVTGIEIHPGAKIGRRLFIDHGMGVVIGQTAEIGDDCTLYHGVTLGDWARIGAGSVVVKPAAPHSTVVGVPGRVVSIKGVAVKDEEAAILEHGRLPDPLEEALSSLGERVARLEEELRAARQAAR
ncbi:MAG: serine acetyltransferase [Acidobacteria bacterium]|nr:serine acetyltransferase [Acidobacteriota bacterium]